MARLSITIDHATIEAIDKRRGDESRSGYAARIIMQHLSRDTAWDTDHTVDHDAAGAIHDMQQARIKDLEDQVYLWRQQADSWQAAAASFRELIPAKREGLFSRIRGYLAGAGAPEE